MKITLKMFFFFLTFALITNSAAVYANNVNYLRFLEGNDAFVAILENVEVWEVVNERGEDVYLFNAATGYSIISAWRFDEHGNIVYIDLIEHAKDINHNARLNAAWDFMHENPEILELLFEGVEPLYEDTKVGALNDNLFREKHRFYHKLLF